MCRLPWLNLTIATWFLYGMIDDESAEWHHTGDERPITFERKIDGVMLPFMEAYGAGNRRPDMVLLSSLYWDEGVFSGHDDLVKFHREHSHSYTYSEIRWHRSRVCEFILKPPTMYGSDLPIMWRTRHFRKSNWMNSFLKLFQLDQSSRSIATAEGVPLFLWGDHLKGYTEYYDNDHHFAKGPATWLFGDMLLFYPQRAVTPGCWRCP